MNAQDTTYKPLPKEVTIKNSPIDRLGLFAVEDIEEGHEFGITHTNDSRFEDGYIRTPLGGFINHSEEPNCKLVSIDEYWHSGGKKIKSGRNCRKLVSIKKISTEEEITTNYSLYKLDIQRSPMPT